MSVQQARMSVGLRRASECSPATRTTRSLLGYGMIAGPIYVAVWLVQALTREGFDLRIHPASLLATGSQGWIQAANFVVCGVMVLLAAAGFKRAFLTGRGARWVPRLIALYGLGLVGAGLFRADPANGFPPGTPAGRAIEATVSGSLHLVSAGLGFTGLIVAAFILARRFAATGEGLWKSASMLTGLFFLAANISGPVLAVQHPMIFNIFMSAAVVAAWGWLTAVSLNAYRTVESE